MSHLQGAMDRIAENDPNLIRYRRVPVGNKVLYHGRVGSMRQGRTTFPATVLQQHPDDGSLDLVVEFEAEDHIWEQRVLPWTEAQPGHCWTLVEPIGPDPNDPKANRIADSALLEIKVEELVREIDKLRTGIIRLDEAMYGEFNPPKKSMIEHLDDFDQRLKAVEKLMRK